MMLYGRHVSNFLALWHITPRGAAFFRMAGHPPELPCSLPVSVLSRVGIAGKKVEIHASISI